MGQPIIVDPYYPGTDCPRCTPPTGSLWEPGKTPEYIWAVFTGIEYCGFSSYQPPNGRLFRIPQDSGNFCLWYKDTGTWRIEFNADRIAPAESRLRLWDKDGWSFFTGTNVPCPQEYSYFDNDQGSCILMYAAKGGQGLIWWNELILELVEMFGFDVGDSLFTDIFSVDQSSQVLRFADVKQRTNVKIKI